jgi:polyisoprenoid-binding protein YceI
MKNRHGFLLVFFFLSYSAIGNNWKINTANSQITFSISNMGSQVEGSFSKYSGNLLFDSKNLKTSLVKFFIDVSSINTKNTKRDKHLQEKSYFNASNYPQIKFISTKFEMISDEKFVVYGNLSIKDVTKEIILPFGAVQKEDKLLITLQNKINRKDYNVGTGLTAAMAIGNEVTISIKLELEKI